MGLLSAFSTGYHPQSVPTHEAHPRVGRETLVAHFEEVNLESFETDRIAPEGTEGHVIVRDVWIVLCEKRPDRRHAGRHRGIVEPEGFEERLGAAGVLARL